MMKKAFLSAFFVFFLVYAYLIFSGQQIGFSQRYLVCVDYLKYGIIYTNEATCTQGPFGFYVGLLFDQVFGKKLFFLSTSIFLVILHSFIFSVLVGIIKKERKQELSRFEFFCFLASYLAILIYTKSSFLIVVGAALFFSGFYLLIYKDKLILPSLLFAVSALSKASFIPVIMLAVVYYFFNKKKFYLSLIIPVSIVFLFVFLKHPNFWFYSVTVHQLMHDNTFSGALNMFFIPRLNLYSVVHIFFITALIISLLQKKRSKFLWFAFLPYVYLTWKRMYHWAEYTHIDLNAVLTLPFFLIYLLNSRRNKFLLFSIAVFLLISNPFFTDGIASLMDASEKEKEISQLTDQMNKINSVYHSWIDKIDLKDKIILIPPDYYHDYFEHKYSNQITLYSLPIQEEALITTVKHIIDRGYFVPEINISYTTPAQKEIYEILINQSFDIIIVDAQSEKDNAVTTSLTSHIVKGAEKIGLLRDYCTHKVANLEAGALGRTLFTAYVKDKEICEDMNKNHQTRYFLERINYCISELNKQGLIIDKIDNPKMACEYLTKSIELKRKELQSELDMPKSLDNLRVGTAYLLFGLILVLLFKSS